MLHNVRVVGYPHIANYANIYDLVNTFNMMILELFDPAPLGYQDERNDKSVLKIDDSRKTRLTLAHLNQLRKSHDVRKLEHEQKLKSVSTQYKPAPEGGAMPGL